MSADDSKPEHQPPNTLPLLAQFASATAQQWRELVEAELEGGSFEQRLITATYEGIPLQPIYWLHDSAELPALNTLPGQPPFLRGASGSSSFPWRVCQSIRAVTAAEAQQQAVQAIAEGATALDLAPNDLPALEGTLDSVDLGTVTLLIKAAANQTLLFTQALLTRADAQQLRGVIGSDPLADLAAGAAIDLDTSWLYLTQSSGWAAQHAPMLATIRAEGLVYYEAGASAVEELAFTLASAVEQLRQLADHGLPVAQSAPHMHFSFALGTQLFMEIAKLRAARLLWSKVIAAWNLDPATAPAIIHAQSGLRTYTIADRHVNMLRATAQAFAATIGGIDSLTILPFDAALQPADDFSRRMALNTQHLLREESLLGAVTDPAGGSWYIETLTDAVARKAWALFQDVERQGGLYAALQSGWVQQQIAATATKRARNIATRRDVLVGTNMYVNPNEEPAPAPLPAAAESAMLRPYRDAAPFEALRAQTAQSPRSAFLANLGPRSQHRARADFALGFLQIAGITVLDNPGFATVEAAAQAAIESGAPIVVICSSDQTYPELVLPLVQQIRAARPATIMVLAGLPAGQQEAMQAAGIDLFIHVRADAVATLDELLKRSAL